MLLLVAREKWRIFEKQFYIGKQEPLLLTWFNFKPSMDK